MSLLLPPSDSTIRELFDMTHLAEIGSPENRKYIPTLYQAYVVASKTLRDDSLIVSINVFALGEDNKSLCLYTLDRSGYQLIWNFGAI